MIRSEVPKNQILFPLEGRESSASSEPRFKTQHCIIFYSKNMKGYLVIRHLERLSETGFPNSNQG